LPSEKPAREVLTYAEGPVNPDPYYQENLVLSDLPAGIYKLVINYPVDGKDKDIQFFVEIFPGQITYFTFTDKEGFQLVPPPPPKEDWFTPTPTPTKSKP